MADTSPLNFEDATTQFLKNAQIVKTNISDRAKDAAALATKYQEAGDLIGSAINSGANVPLDANRMPVTPEAVAQQAQAALDSQRTIRTFNARLGADPSQSGALVNTLADKLAKATQMAIQDAQAVHDNLSTGFLDDPVKYVVNQFTLDGDVKKAEASKRLAEVTATGLVNINTVSQTVGRTVAAAQANSSDAVVQSQKEAAFAKISSDFNKEKQQNLGKGIDFISNLNSWDTQQLNAVGAQTEALYRGRSLALNEKQFALQSEATRQQMTIQLSDFDFRKLTQQGEINMANATGAGLRSLGFQISDADLAPGKVLAMLKSGNGVYAKGLEAGAQMATTGVTVYGLTTAEAAHTVNVLKAPGQLEQSPIIDLFRSEWANAASTGPAQLAMIGAKSINEKGVLETITGNAVKKAADAMYKNVKVGDPTNIFSPLPTSELLTVKGVADTPFAKNVLIPSIQKGENVEFNPDRLIGQGLEAMKQGKVSLEQVAEGISTIGTAARLRNAGVKQYVGFGISPPKALNMEIDNIGYMGGKKIMDVSSYKSVMQALTLRQRNEITAAGRDSAMESGAY